MLRRGCVRWHVRAGAHACAMLHTWSVHTRVRGGRRSCQKRLWPPAQTQPAAKTAPKSGRKGQRGGGGGIGREGEQRGGAPTALQEAEGCRSLKGGSESVEGGFWRSPHCSDVVSKLHPPLVGGGGKGGGSSRTLERCASLSPMGPFLCYRGSLRSTPASRRSRPPPPTPPLKKSGIPATIPTPPHPKHRRTGQLRPLAMRCPKSDRSPRREAERDRR